MNTVTQTEARAEYIAGLRALADALETNPQLRLPFTGSYRDMSHVNVHPTSREEMAAWAELMSEIDKQGMRGESLYEVVGQIAGLGICVIAAADKLGGRSVRRQVESFEVEPFVPQQVGA